jgi:hypothetical protein
MTRTFFDDVKDVVKICSLLFDDLAHSAKLYKTESDLSSPVSEFSKTLTPHLV